VAEVEVQPRARGRGTDSIPRAAIRRNLRKDDRREQGKSRKDGIGVNSREFGG
jgi:hypothetical protein